MTGSAEELGGAPEILLVSPGTEFEWSLPIIQCLTQHLECRYLVNKWHCLTGWNFLWYFKDKKEFQRLKKECKNHWIKGFVKLTVLWRQFPLWNLVSVICVLVCSVMCDSATLDCSLPGSSVHGFLQARIQKWVAMPFSRGIFLTQATNPCFYISCIGSGFFTAWAILREAVSYLKTSNITALRTKYPIPLYKIHFLHLKNHIL